MTMNTEQVLSTLVTSTGSHWLNWSYVHWLPTPISVGMLLDTTNLQPSHDNTKPRLSRQEELG